MRTDTGTTGEIIIQSSEQKHDIVGQSKSQNVLNAVGKTLQRVTGNKWLYNVSE